MLSTLALASVIAVAQPSPSLTLEETLQFCAQIEDQQDKLACFEGLAAAIKSEDEKTAEADSADDNKASDKPTASRVDPTPGEMEAQKPAEMAQEEPEEVSTPRFVIMTSEEAEKQQKAADAVKKLSKPREAYRATVLKSWRYSATNEQYVALTNGEIWKKIDRVKGRSIRDGLEITLTPGAVSGWLMKFDDKRPALRVKLVK